MNRTLVAGPNSACALRRRAAVPTARQYTAKPQSVRPPVLLHNSSALRLGSCLASVRRGHSATVCSAGVAHPNEESNQNAEINNQLNTVFMSVPNVTMAKGGSRDMGSGSSFGAALLERSKVEFVMPTPPVVGPKLDDGGSGGDIGKRNHNGGGGGDGGDGDDDDYFAEGDGGDGDGDGETSRDSFFRVAIAESYDKLSIAAVMAEWMRTVADLPLIIRRAVEMGLFSSAQLVRFFSMDVRPGVTRSVSRSLPPTWARELVGRLMADPAFLQKVVLESMFAAGGSLWYEYRARGPENFKKELDLVMINTLGMAAATSATVWLVAPTRSYGNVHKFPWQQMLDGLPNCVFDASGPLRQYTKQARVGGFLAKAAELSAVGAVMGTATSLLSSAAVALHKQSDPSYEPSVAVPDATRSASGLAAFFAVNANTRYQLIGGLDRYLFGHSNFLWTYLGMSGVARLISSQAGELSRPWWQGLPEPGQVVMRKRVARRVVRKVQRVKPAVMEASAVPVVAAASVAFAEPLTVPTTEQYAASSSPAAEEAPSSHFTTAAEPTAVSSSADASLPVGTLAAMDASLPGPLSAELQQPASSSQQLAEPPLTATSQPQS